MVGTLNFKRPWTYTVFATTHTFDKGFDTKTDDEFTWFDYRLDIPLPADLTLSVGKQKEPISLERQMPKPTTTSPGSRTISKELMRLQGH